MLTLRVRNVNQAYLYATGYLRACGEAHGSRAGDVIEYPEPVCTVYERPCERVLFDAGRDANPFFHFMEALGYLAGSVDVEWYAHFNKRMREYSDDGKTLPASYGYRWLKYFDFDQLEAVADMLRVCPEQRRAVVAMHDPADLVAWRRTKDQPCNTHLYFKIRHGRLDMTSCCRSNDLLWGAYGANAVHLSMAHELVAARVGVQVGRWWQQSDSLHVYLDVWRSTPEPVPGPCPYVLGHVKPLPLFEEPGALEEDLDWFIHWRDFPQVPSLRNAAVRSVGVPMLYAWEAHREKRPQRALEWASMIDAEDWRRACTEWLERRTHGKA
jgi:hypothetical protein